MIRVFLSSIVCLVIFSSARSTFADRLSVARLSERMVQAVPYRAVQYNATRIPPVASYFHRGGGVGRH